MPHQVPLSAGDPRRVGRYRLTGRLEGLPSDDPIFIGTGPDGAEVSISMLGSDWAMDGAARDRFAAEAAVARRVPPFCAARVLDAGVEGTDAYLVSEYVSGESLLEQVAAGTVRHGPELEALAIGMATGLASVHQAGLVHGGFGPQYVLLPAGAPPRVVEFGITPPYGTATPSADMLAWAQTVVFAASGRPPSGSRGLELLPERLREPVQQCLELAPSERPAARAVVQFLLGDSALPAGVLAEGTRRATRAASRSILEHAPSGSRQAGAGPAPGSRPAPSDRPRASRPHPVPDGRASADRDRAAGGRRSGVAGPRPAPHHGGRATARSKRAMPWIVAGAAVAIALLVALVVHLLQGGGRQDTGQLSADTHHPSATTSASPRATSPTPSQGPVVPAAFAGSWSGQVTQPPTDTYNVTVTFAAGQPGGTISYTGSDFTCSGDLSLTSASSTKLTLSQGIIVGQKTCENGSVVITGTGSNSIFFDFQSTPVASGTLSRT